MVKLVLMGWAWTTVMIIVFTHGTDDPIQAKYIVLGLLWLMFLLAAGFAIRNRKK